MALCAEVALAAVLDLHCLLQLVELVNLSGAFLNESLSLLHCESILPVDLVFVEGNLWLLVHDAGGDWRPLCVLLAISFLCLELKFKLLSGAKLHDNDRVFRLSSFGVDELHWLNRDVLITSENIC